MKIKQEKQTSQLNKIEGKWCGFLSANWY